MTAPTAAVTLLLRRWSAGDDAVEDDLFRAIYAELEAIATRLLQRERPGHSLQPPSVVSEAYLRLKGSDCDYSDRTHFFAVATRVMRRLLIDHARGRGRAKRGGGHRAVTLLTDLHAAAPAPMDVEALEDALACLEAHDARKAEMVQMRHLAGMSNEEIAQATGFSVRTVKRDLRFAKAFVRKVLEDHAAN